MVEAPEPEGASAQLSGDLEVRITAAQVSQRPCPSPCVLGSSFLRQGPHERSLGVGRSCTAAGARNCPKKV